MKTSSRILFLVTVMVILTSSKSHPVRILMAGDSTMAEKPLTKTVTDSISGEKSEEIFLERGWGMLVSAYFDENVSIINLAQNGRSTRTFIEQGWWDKITSQLHKGDFVVIQFGHNDGAKDRADKYTSPEDYKANLIRMVEDVRTKKGKPILCTSIMRRKFDKNGKIIDTHGVYPEITREVAKLKKVPMIDMQKMTWEWLEKEGIEQSKQYFHKIPADGKSKLFPKGLDDNTHLNEAGAKVVAGMFVEEIKHQKIKSLAKKTVK